DGEEEILVDAGTFTYVDDPIWRDRFRGSAAHNTIRINGRDQATPSNPFRWESKPEVEMLEWRTGEREDNLLAVCHYDRLTHRRRVRFEKPDRLLIEDIIEGPPGEHHIEQFWHFGGQPKALPDGSLQIGERCALQVAGHEIEVNEGGEFGWRSR